MISKWTVLSLLCAQISRDNSKTSKWCKISNGKHEERYFQGFKKGKLDGNDDFRNLNQAATFFKATSERPPPLSLELFSSMPGKK